MMFWEHKLAKGIDGNDLSADVDLAGLGVIRSPDQAGYKVKCLKGTKSRVQACTQIANNVSSHSCDPFSSSIRKESGMGGSCTGVSLSDLTAPTSLKVRH